MKLNYNMGPLLSFPIFNAGSGKLTYEVLCLIESMCLNMCIRSYLSQMKCIKVNEHSTYDYSSELFRVSSIR